MNRIGREIGTACLAATCLVAAVHAEMHFERAEHFPHIGLVLPRLSRAKADPLPMPDTHTFLPVNRTSTLLREDRYSPYELWYGRECCARWVDEYGDRLILGRITRRFPEFAEDEESGELAPVTRDTFLHKIEETRYQIDPKKQSQVDEWVATFVDATVYPPERRDINGFVLERVLCYSNDASRLIYAFRPRHTANNHSPDWFCVTAEMPAVADYKAWKESFEEEFIGKIRLPGRTETDGVTSSEVFPDGKKQAETFPYSPIREAARKSVENYDDWWVAESEGYVMLSDVYSEIGKSFLRELQKLLPLFHRAYAALLPPLDTQGQDVAVIRVFQMQEDYKRYVGEDRAWTAAVWMPMRRELVLFQNAGIEVMLPTVQHEAFHQYISHAYAMIQPAAWFNEGHACFFEAGSLNGRGKVIFTEDLDKAYLLQDNLRAAVAKLPELLTASYQDFYAQWDGERRLNYAIAWGLCYYLQKGVPSGVAPEGYREILPRYAEALARTRDGVKATLEAFAEIDLPKFQQNFQEFWEGERLRAAKYDPLEK
ncbi:MAG: DUF1570 domain-containing protein [Kiritimatiellae bacterium]|nr:DUF1570 domain-containing protein [Kiritimatiellia bacterium]